MRALVDRYRADPRAAALATAIAEQRSAVFGALHGALAAVLLAAAGRRPPLLVSEEAQRVVDDLEELGVPAVRLPELEPVGDERDDQGAWARRAAALEAFAAGSWLVASPRSLQQPVPDLAETAARSRVLRPGDRLDLHALAEHLVGQGFRSVPAVEGRGELAIRGGILDVFPWVGELPLRLEFFGDTLETIRRFDPFTQESVARAEEAVLATPGAGLATRELLPQLPAGPLVVFGDVPLTERLGRDPGRAEIRLGAQLPAGAEDGGSVGVGRLSGDLKRGMSGLAALLAEGAGEALLLARSPEAAAELAAHLRDARLEMHASVQVGRLSGGWRDLARGLLVVHDFELAERVPARRRARVAGGAPLDSLADLATGELCVHIEHGICRFRGIVTLERQGYLRDHLQLEFADEAKLYVPVDCIDLVQKYIGTGGREPPLSKLGGRAWKAARARAERAIEDLSAELLTTHAARVAHGGYAFPPDDAEVRRFEASFPYEETADQLAAVREIKADMERPVPMDRLLCGDVGFGKTEVAMRAAFKAVRAGKQVAVLVPTTILAEQHLVTFRARMEPFAVRIAGLTRFRAGREQRAILADAAAGRIDILIGTHALLTPQLAFKDLGLLIIDEEHRFGVKHKEALKKLRVGVDVLTLSATPIPRTLHFSMLGLRDISVLAEPPAERLAVETRVCPWDEALIASALARELARQGQVFVVHNDIAALDHTAWRLQRIAERARLALRLEVVHGQMEEERIARIMDDFRAQRLDCLVSTSIIESGIDIPNANTLFVVDAQRFGLAELHQLRGRIGRFTRQAYAYFLTPPKRDIGEEARERLAAIQEYAELGAGFKLAMRDLELRGAGNLLGVEQSGAIDAIGYELYTRLLAQAVARLRGAEAAPAAARAAGDELIVGLQVSAYIPDDWLESSALRFELHRRIDRARRHQDLEAIAREARDRFGRLPVPVQRLLQLAAIKLRLAELGIRRVELADRCLRLHLSGPLPKELAAVRLPELVHLQLDGPVLALFVRGELSGERALELLRRLTGAPEIAVEAQALAG
ncbi:MAG: transcription-repair coupling factor [Planctomycetota bacterium]|nr:transcription-repair coupling factor [Planctomycetota bacterium]MDW8372572.1 transcription-repair coupling factor [Planctomycetota bacterium]